MSKRSNISIHAPVKGATGQRPGGVRPVRHFNPRSREGSDTVSGSHFVIPTHFNPRSREGSDPTIICNNSGLLYFNPRSREGSDDWILMLV